MNVSEFELTNPSQTKKLGEKIANSLNNRPSLIFLRGEMGTGKTTFAQGFIKTLLKNHQSVLSPSYAYMHSYDHVIQIFHFDLYRIDYPDQIAELGLSHFIDDDNAIRLIEWPERIASSGIIPDIDIHLIYKDSSRLAIVRHSPIVDRCKIE